MAELRSRKKKEPENLVKKRADRLPTFTEKSEEDLKRELFSEVKNVETDEEESPYYDEIPDVHRKRPDSLWDVILEDEILYFDPELSYEVTGYRPISETEGLDFDPAPFRETGQIYEKTGRYTAYPKGSKPYVDFWHEQIRRCVEGYTVGKYRVTGDHYFFLNFYRMGIVDDKKKAGAGSDESFPFFTVEQYKYFHYIEICEYLKQDSCALKARAVKTCRTI